MANAKNEQRPRLILESAVHIIGRSGPSAVTHRAVAAEADVPLAATTYYFSSKEELLTEALQLAARHDLAELDRLTAAVLDDQPSVACAARALASFLQTQLEGRRTTVIAQYELMLEAARRESLQSASQASADEYAARLARILERLGAGEALEGARLLLVAMDGMLIHQLASPAASFELHATAAGLQRLISGLLAVDRGSDPVDAEV